MNIVLKIKTFKDLEKYLEANKSYWDSEINAAHKNNDFGKMQYCIGRKHSAHDLLHIVKHKIKKA